MMKYVARCLLRISGWTWTGGVPEDPKAVLIAAPHTSNWDGFWALTYKIAIGLDVRFFAKHTLFWFPLGTILRNLGGIPLDRKKAASAVAAAVALFDANETFYFGLAPEGTRGRRDAWKTGFYRIATEAKVPILLGYLDYRTKTIGISGRLDPSGDMDTDLQVCADFYAAFEGRRPERTSPVRSAE
jgi:1-acyl-sn-glycerol-3-phosphate acyltransferase